MSGIFSRWQPRYAEHGIATFPVRIEGKDKRPLSKGYQRTGIRGSAILASKFTEANAFGLVLGPHNKIEIVDVDTKEERALADALSIYGNSPIISRTASGGGFHIWYRHSEDAWQHYPTARRETRPDPSKPFDFLAAGMMVAPPSIGPLGQYDFIEGGLDDLDSLKPLASPVPPRRLPDSTEAVLLPSLPVVSGTRNNRAWRFAMQRAKAVPSFECLLGELARSINCANRPWRRKRSCAFVNLLGDTPRTTRTASVSTALFSRPTRWSACCGIRTPFSCWRSSGPSRDRGQRSWSPTV
jgi:hypothetical protein